MISLEQIYTFLDPALIFPFRAFSNPVAGFWLGTSIISLYCVILGEITMSMVYAFNREYYIKLTKEMVDMHNTSIDAIRHKDKKIFKASNSWANEYFGKLFFAQMALFATSLWPVPFALGWLSTRFTDVTIHNFFSLELGYPFVLISSYILIRFAFSKIKRYIPFISRVHKMRLEDANKTGQIKSWSDLGQSADSVKSGVETARQP